MTHRMTVPGKEYRGPTCHILSKDWRLEHYKGQCQNKFLVDSVDSRLINAKVDTRVYYKYIQEGSAN